MKAWIALVKFKDGSSEGVMFTDEGDANTAMRGGTPGSTLALEFFELYGEECVIEKVEVEI